MLNYKPTDAADVMNRCVGLAQSIAFKSKSADFTYYTKNSHGTTLQKCVIQGNKPRALAGPCLLTPGSDCSLVLPSPCPSSWTSLIISTFVPLEKYPSVYWPLWHSRKDHREAKWYSVFKENEKWQHDPLCAKTSRQLNRCVENVSGPWEFESVYLMSYPGPCPLPHV